MAGGAEGPQLQKLIRRNTVVLAGCMALGWSVVQLFASLGAVTVSVLTGRPGLAGLGPAVFLVSWALASPAVGAFMDLRGRAAGLRAGFIAATVGALVLFFGTEARSLILALTGLLVVGAGTGAVNLARAGGADMYPPERRARGISFVLLGAAVGAIIGLVAFAPLLAGVRRDPSGLAGPWLIAAAVLAVGFLLTFAIRVDPAEIGRRMRPFGQAEQEGRTLLAMLRLPVVQVALLAAAAAQGVMTSFMTIGGLILVDHGHDLAAVSLSLTVHFMGMFGLVLVVGRIVDRIGHAASIVMGLALLAAGVLGFLAGADMGSILPSMFTVGLGWNVAFVAATAMLANASHSWERARLVGFGDLAAFGSAAAGAIVAAAILDAGGLAPLVLVATGIAIFPAAVVLGARIRNLLPSDQGPRS